MKQNGIVVFGLVTEELGASRFRVVLDDGREIKPYVSPTLTKKKIRVIPGDRVEVELTVYDLDNGRIIYRHKK